jgi:ElaA protein
MCGRMYPGNVKHRCLLKMDVVIKEFNRLSAKELFDIYKLRSEVFVVEQNCAYQDPDEKDLQAIHVTLFEKHTLAGYSRIIPPGVSYKEPSIGRVVVAKEFRTNGYGKILMKQSINKALDLFKDQGIVISAQTYLTKFYTELGFQSEGNGYLEDNIPHIKMRYKL